MRRLMVGLLAVTLFVHPAHAGGPPAVDTPTEIGSGAACVSRSGTEFELPPGAVCVPPAWWTAADAEHKRRGDAETRLKAENESLRQSLRKRPVRWYYIAGVAAAAFALGATVERLR